MIYLSLEVYETLSSTLYSGKTMTAENDIIMMNNKKRDLGYTGVGDKQSKRKTFFTITLPKLLEEIQNKTFEKIEDDSDFLEGQGVKIIIPSNIFDIYTRLEILLGIKLSGHTDAPTEAINLIDELYKRGEVQIKQQIRKAVKKIRNQHVELPSKILEQIAFNTRTKIEEHLLNVMDKRTQEEHLSQPLHTNSKQFKLAVTFLTGYNGKFNVTNKNKKFYLLLHLAM